MSVLFGLFVLFFPFCSLLYVFVYWPNTALALTLSLIVLCVCGCFSSPCTSSHTWATQLTNHFPFLTLRALSSSNPLYPPPSSSAQQMAEGHIHHCLWGASRLPPILAWRAAPRGVSLPAPRCQRSWACQLLLRQLQMLLICRLMYFGRVVSECWWVKHASHPIRAEQISGRFTRERQSDSLEGVEMQVCEKQFLTVKVLLLFSVVVRLWQEYWDTVALGVGVGASVIVSCVRKK